MKSYKVRYELDETGWWVATIPALPGCHSQGRTIEQAEERIREALALFVPEKVAASADLAADIRLPLAAKRALSEATKKREQADIIVKQSQDAARAAARALAKQGLSLRDVGKLLGVTRQRAHQLVGG
jgi:predicted RNase H-like HicB family nuclease